MVGCVILEVMMKILLGMLLVMMLSVMVMLLMVVKMLVVVEWIIKLFNYPSSYWLRGCVLISWVLLKIKWSHLIQPPGMSSQIHEGWWHLGFLLRLSFLKLLLCLWQLRHERWLTSCVLIMLLHFLMTFCFLFLHQIQDPNPRAFHLPSKGSANELKPNPYGSSVFCLLPG